MNRFPKLNLPPCRLRVSEEGGRVRVWDDMRSLWLAMTPEEWIRRHVINWLTEGMGAPAERISQEYPVRIQGMKQRADIVVCGGDGGPLMLVECKAPDVAIDAGVYAQAVRYNNIAGARYLMITNGMHHFFYEKTEDGDYAVLKEIPALG